jgi:hypothetical protein
VSGSEVVEPLGERRHGREGDTQGFCVNLEKETVTLPLGFFFPLYIDSLSSLLVTYLMYLFPFRVRLHICILFPLSNHLPR